MSTSLPAAPAAPDYAAANREGITTDISTLPLRNQINQAAQLGQKITYKDPVTGEDKVADFTGMGNAAAAQQAATILADTNASIQRQQLALRQELGTANAAQTAAELRAADPAAYAARQALTGRINDDLSGKADYAGYVRTNPDLAAAFAKERDESGGTLTIDEWGKRHYDTYGEKEGRQLTRTGGAGADEVGLDTSAAKLNDRVRALGEMVPDGQNRMAELYAKAMALDTSAEDGSTAALGRAFDQAQQEFALGSKLDTDSERELTNQARAGQVARGNYLGDAAAVAEATTLGQAGQAMKQQRLSNLLGIQEKVFGQTGALRNESRNAQLAQLGQLGQIAGQDFGQANTTFGNRMNSLQMENGLNAQQLAETRATRNENYARQQQKLANASAMVLGMPVTNQFGSLGAAQNGAVGAAQPINYAAAGQVNQNAGQQAAGFAQQNYGTGANIWQTQANAAQQGSPWAALGGAALGAFTGGAGAAGGAALGKSIFG